MHVNGECLYFDGRLVIPGCLGNIMLHQLHGAHPGYFALKNLATLYIWWPKIYHEILVYGENCIECVKAGKNFKPLLKQEDRGKLLAVIQSNQEMELDFAGPLPLTYGRKNILVCVDRFLKHLSAKITSRTF